VENGGVGRGHRRRANRGFVGWAVCGMFGIGVFFSPAFAPGAIYDWRCATLVRTRRRLSFA